MKVVVYLAADHRGFALKASLSLYLRHKGFEVSDCGNIVSDPHDDYPDFARAVTNAMATHPASFGILICGSGVGMAIAANRMPHIRAAVAQNPEDARRARNDEDANVLVLGSDRVDAAQAQEIVDAFFETPTSQDVRHIRRRAKLG